MRSGGNPLYVTPPRDHVINKIKIDAVMTNQILTLHVLSLSCVLFASIRLNNYDTCLLFWLGTVTEIHHSNAMSLAQNSWIDDAHDQTHTNRWTRTYLGSQ